jgi:pyroglutamyl-peptidase
MVTGTSEIAIRAHRTFGRFLLGPAMAVMIYSLGCAATDLAGLATAAPAEEKVILLTGFEPFGESRPPNPSWEGIRNLDGQKWNGFRLKAVELPVVWGEPLPNLKAQMEKHQPVAIFSFGQGAPGQFAIESRAHNQRGEIQDNRGNLPTTPLIVEDGKSQLSATLDCQALANRLKKKGYPVRVSDNAGRYLCEETLYSLESLRKQDDALTVSFCHVPPLGTTITEKGEKGDSEKTITSEYVQSFVLDYLLAWHELTAETGNAALIAPGATPVSYSVPQKDAKDNNTETRAVERLIQNYFQSWSDQRMKDYGDCFADDSVVQEISGGRIHTQMKGPFVTTQATYHKMALFKAVEVPVRTDISFQGELAYAVVYWKLTAGPRTQFGYDHFTLMKQKDQWKIVNLVFYGTRPVEK